MGVEDLTPAGTRAPEQVMRVRHRRLVTSHSQAV